MHPILQKIHSLGIVPVVKIDAPAHALPLGEALLAGDLPVAEITFRTAAAEESIKRLSGELPDLLVGAGTVITSEQAEKAIKAGAKFIVSPGFNEPVVDYCLEHGVPVTPGVNSPSQIEQGLYKGLEVLKFFPAEASGGMAMLKAMSAPYNNLKFIPTGGIKTANMHEYLDFSKVLAIGGSWMVKPEFIAEERFEEVTRLSREAVVSMLGFSLQHIGINTSDEAAAKRGATLFSTFFPGKLGESEKSMMVGGAVELMKVPGRGTDGHIAIGTTNITRAAAFLERKGFALDHQNAVEKDGRVKALFLQDEIAGFAVHLLES